MTIAYSLGVVSGLPHLVHDLESALDAAAAPRLSRRDVPRELLVPATVRSLVRMAVEEWAMIGALGVAIALVPWWLYPVVAVLMAGRFHALGVILHDATHMPLRHKTFGVRVVEVLCGYPIASTINAMRYHHLRHHRDSGWPTDPYYKDGTQNALWWVINTVRGVLLVPFWSIRGFLGVIAFAVPAVRNVYAHGFLQDRTREDLRRDREVIDCARADIGQAMFQLSVILLAVWFPAVIVWGYVVPVTVAGLFSARRVLIEHRYERTSDRRVDTIIATTNDNYLGLLGVLALAPRNIGYHIVHHIHPQVTLAALPRLRRWYLSQHPDLYPLARR